MDIYVINLAQRTDRLRQITKQLGDFDLPFTRIEAVNGLGDDDIGYPADHSRLSKGEFACYLSHVLAWQNLVASPSHHCLILEDDAIFSPRAEHVIKNTRFFDHGHAITRLETRKRKVSLLAKPLKTVQDFSLHEVQVYEGGAGAYVLKRDFAAHLLRHHRQPKIPVDDQIMDANATTYPKNKPLQLIPAISTQQLFLEPQGEGQGLLSDLDADRVDFQSMMRPKTLRAKLRREIAYALTHRRRFGARARMRIQIPFADQDLH